jgi:hypothetical protein
MTLFEAPEMSRVFWSGWVLRPEDHAWIDVQVLQASAAGSVHVQRDISGVRGGHVFPETA